MKNEATSAVQMLTPEGKTIQTLDVAKESLIEAPIDIVWESVLEEMGPGGIGGDNKPMPMKVELWPGGRWFRDLGNNAGHLWGHIQVVKPPKLLEVTGPLFMSYPALSHVQYRLVEESGKTRLKLTHRAVGMIDPDHARGVNTGWQEVIDQIVEIAKRRVKTGK